MILFSKFLKFLKKKIFGKEIFQNPKIFFFDLKNAILKEKFINKENISIKKFLFIKRCVFGI